MKGWTVKGYRPRVSEGNWNDQIRTEARERTCKIPDEGCFLLRLERTCVVHTKMAKRGADKELTQDNWDQEEDEDEVFSLFYIFMFF